MHRFICPSVPILFSSFPFSSTFILLLMIDGGFVYALLLPSILPSNRGPATPPPPPSPSPGHYRCIPTSILKRPRPPSHRNSIFCKIAPSGGNFRDVDFSPRSVTHFTIYIITIYQFSRAPVFWFFFFFPIGVFCAYIRVKRFIMEFTCCNETVRSPLLIIFRGIRFAKAGERMSMYDWGFPPAPGGV